jgi:hypothetical protein
MALPGHRQAELKCGLTVNEEFKFYSTAPGMCFSLPSVLNELLILGLLVPLALHLCKELGTGALRRYELAFSNVIIDFKRDVFFFPGWYKEFGHMQRLYPADCMKIQHTALSWIDCNLILPRLYGESRQYFA